MSSNSRLKSRAWIALCGLVLTSAALAASPSYDHYKSWLVACDNGLTCEAKGFTQDSGGTPDLRIIRAAGPDGAIRMDLNGDLDLALNKLRVDGKPLNLDVSAWKVTRYKSDGFATLSSTTPSAVEQLLAILRNGKNLQVGSKPDAAVPLDGMVAALLRMDDRQGRIGGVTALIRKGPTPAAQVPPAPALPSVPPHKIDAALAKGEEQRLIQRYAKHGDDTDCDDAPQGESAAYALDANTALVLTPCLSGAYQTNYDVRLTSRQAGNAERPLRLPDPSGQDVGHDVMEAAFDPATGTLSSNDKGRGIDDCGSSTSWVWDGKNFVLSSASLQSECGGYSAGDFPTIYRSAQ
jgi:hypothetical protein